MAREKQKIDGDKFAFPIPDGAHTTGITIRDYFAAKAMQSVFCDTFKNGEISHWNYETTAGTCYRIADEMIKERNK